MSLGDSLDRIFVKIRRDAIEHLWDWEATNLGRLLYEEMLDVIDDKHALPGWLITQQSRQLGVTEEVFLQSTGRWRHWREEHSLVSVHA